MNLERFFSERKLFLINIILVSVIAGFLISSAVFSCSTSTDPTRRVLSHDAPPVTLASMEGLQSSFRDVARAVLPVVVEIRVMENRSAGNGGRTPFDFFFGPLDERRTPSPVPGVGSGVIVEEDGGRYYVVTNEHVAANADEITVVLEDGSSYPATLEGRDTRKDLAVVSFAARRGVIPVAVLGDSDLLYVGDWVMAVGNPFGFTSTVTVGIVSAMNRSGPRGNISDFIQTDAAINQGNSGGPLVNLKGEVVGINTWISTDTGMNVGLGFAIPINNAKKAIRDIIRLGEVEYGWLGVEIADIPESFASEFRYTESRGAIILQIFNESPADRSGIVPGDIVLELNGTEIRDYMHLVRLVGDLEPGQPAEFRIWRLGEVLDLVAVIGVRAEADSLQRANSAMWPGFSVYPLSDTIREELGAPGAVDGVYIQNVKRGTPPDAAGLEPFDIITRINKRPVKNIVDFFIAMNDTNNKAYELWLLRNGEELVIGVEYTHGGGR